MSNSPAQEPPVPRGGIHVGEDGQLDAVGLDRAFLQRADDLIVATGQRNGEFFRHIDTLV
jgi:hypothetical protein